MNAGRARAGMWVLAVLCVCGAGCARGIVTIARPLSVPLSVPRTEARSEGVFAQKALSYEVSWLGIPVGGVSVTVDEDGTCQGRSCVVIRLRARTNGFCSRIYRIDDEFVSYVDRERLVSLRHMARRAEGRFRKDAVTDFDYTAGVARFYNAVDGSSKEFAIPAAVQDPLTAVYYMRALDLRAGHTVSFAVVNNEKVHDVRVRIAEPVLVRIGGRGYPAYPVFPRAFVEGVEVKKGAASGYLAAADGHLPLAAVVRTPVFTKVTVLLSEEEGSLP